METLYNLEFYELKDKAEKVYIVSKHQFDDDYLFNVFFLVKKQKLAEFVREFK